MRNFALRIPDAEGLEEKPAQMAVSIARSIQKKLTADHRLPRRLEIDINRLTGQHRWIVDSADPTAPPTARMPWERTCVTIGGR
jgi:hypothetical protein